MEAMMRIAPSRACCVFGFAAASSSITSTCTIAITTCTRRRRRNKFSTLHPIPMASRSQMASPQETLHAHQEAAARLPPLVQARTLLHQCTRGVLSTLSLEHQGYPSASMVDFACHQDDGSPILALSSLALHSKHLSANPKCCLLVAKDPHDRTDTLITLYGDAIPVSLSLSLSLFSNFYFHILHVNTQTTTFSSKSKTYISFRSQEGRVNKSGLHTSKHIPMHFGYLLMFKVDFGDFSFIQIKPTVIRYVSGVATARLGSGEFTAEEYKSAKVDPISQFARPIMSHMNKDHSEDTKLIVQHSTSIKVDSAYMLDVDSLGFDVKAEYEGRTMKLRIPFPRPAQERKDVKNLIVEMLQAAKGDAE